MGIIGRMLGVLRGGVVDVVVPTINIIDRSTLLGDGDFQAMVEACRVQLEQHVAPMWMRGKWNIVVNQPEEVGYPIVIVDDADHAGALGYHTESPGGKVWGRVFVKPVLNGGGSMLRGHLSVSAVLSHEVIEAYCDPNVNLWADMGNGMMVVYEACDPVQADVYDIVVKGGTAVSVSNFILPNWFDRLVKSGTKLDFMAKLQRPFSMSQGGYMVVRDSKSGEIKNIFGSIEAEGLRHQRQGASHPAARSSRKTTSF